MDNRSFESGAAASPPAAPASPSVGHPTAGDPQTAVPATKPGPYWFYQLGEELRAVLTAAGITPDNTNLTQVLTALRSAGVFQTAAQFDNTTKVATAAFVQGARGNVSGISAPNTSTVLAASHAGQLILFNGLNAGQTLTLPPAASVLSGTSIHFTNAAGIPVTIAGNAAEVIVHNTVGADSISANLLILGKGDSTTLIQSGGSWYELQGLRTEALGANSIASSGYQKLPSGLIIQWGFGATVAGSLAVTLPITFPTGNLIGMASTYGGSTNLLATVNAMSASQITIATVTSSTGVAANGQMAWIAIGK